MLDKRDAFRGMASRVRETHGTERQSPVSPDQVGGDRRAGRSRARCRCAGHRAWGRAVWEHVGIRWCGGWPVSRKRGQRVFARYRSFDSGRMIIYGINPVLEALPRRTRHGRCVSRSVPMMTSLIVPSCWRWHKPAQKVQVEHREEPVTCSTGPVVACIRASWRAEEASGTTAWRTGARRGTAPLIVLLDGIEDPHNLGAILRTVGAAGSWRDCADPAGGSVGWRGRESLGRCRGACEDRGGGQHRARD